MASSERKIVRNGEKEDGEAALLADLAALNDDAECPLHDYTLISDSGLKTRVDDARTHDTRTHARAGTYVHTRAV